MEGHLLPSNRVCDVLRGLVGVSVSEGTLYTARAQCFEAFSGHAVHEGWKSYQAYDCEHVLGNAHHLRELQSIWEQYGQGWAFQMSLLLTTIHPIVEALKPEGKSA